MDSLLEATSLPNLHPAMVHFPIALLPVALLFDLSSLVSKKRWLARAASLLWLLAALGTMASTWAGERAVESLVGLEPRDHLQIGHHSDWAHWTLWTVLGLVALRLVVAFRDRSDGLGLVALRWVLVGVGLVATGLVMRTADLGGALVYRLGIAVATEDSSDTETGSMAPSAEEPDTPRPGVDDPPENRLVEDEGGVLTWTPLSTDGEALGTVLLPAPGATLDAVRVASVGGTGVGLGLEVDGETMLLLPGEHGDVQVDAELDLSAFEGRVGLVHHARSTRTAGLFTLTTSGAARLVALEGDSTELLDEQTTQLPESPLEIGVSSAGRHLKGLVEGKMVTHGHIAPGEDGACGLLLDGTGTVVIVSLRVTPLS